MSLFQRIGLGVKAILGDEHAKLAKVVMSRSSEKYIIYGMGIFGQKLFRILDQLRLTKNLVAVFDSKAEHNKHSYGGYEILSPTNLKDAEFDYVVVGSGKFVSDIIAIVEDNLGEKGIDIVHL